MTAEDTIPKLFLKKCDKWSSSKIAMRQKDLGIWMEYTWKEVYEIVKYSCLGFMALGLQKGDKVSILGDNCVEWVCNEYAIQAAGGVVVGLFPDSIPSELEYLLDHSDSKFVVARDQEQIDKILSIKLKIPKISQIIYLEQKGMNHYDDPLLMSFKRLRDLGEEYERNQPGIFEETVTKGTGTDVARLLYTSGTTGLPKGVIVTHDWMLWNQTILYRSWGEFNENDDQFALSPLGWMLEALMSCTGPALRGVKLNFAESPETVRGDLREVSPSIVMYNPRQWDEIISMIKSRMAEANPLAKFIYDLCLPIGYKVANLKLQKRKVNLFWKCLHILADWILFRPIRDRIGLSKTKVCATGGFALGHESLKYLTAIGLKLVQVYGSTEEGIITTHKISDIKVESVGTPNAGVQIKISEAGEIWAKNPIMFTGYYKNQEMTDKRKLGKGWQATGDAGHIDDDGHLIFSDRLDDLRKVSNGEVYSPQNIESRLRFSPYIKDALALGGEGAEYVSTIINVDFETVRKWSEDRKLTYRSFAELSQSEEVANLIRTEIQWINRALQQGSRIKKFVLLHKEFDPDEAELTRTRKVRRSYMEKDRYRDIVDAIYAGKREIPMAFEVRYRDGRRGEVKTDIKINLTDSETS